MGFDYARDKANKTDLKTGEVFVKRKISQPPVHQMRLKSNTIMSSPKGETVSNRFYDTFAKFQKINLNREVPSPTFRKPGQGLGQTVSGGVDL